MTARPVTPIWAVVLIAVGSWRFWRAGRSLEDVLESAVPFGSEDFLECVVPVVLVSIAR
jgi:hypothetical protein